MGIYHIKRKAFSIQHTFRKKLKFWTNIYTSLVISQPWTTQPWTKPSYSHCLKLPLTWTADSSEFFSGQDKVWVDFSVDVTNGTGSSIAAVALLSPNKTFCLPRTNWSSEALLCLFTESTVPQCAASLSFDDKNCCLISRIFVCSGTISAYNFCHTVAPV